MPEPTPQEQRALRRMTERFAGLWARPELPAKVTVRFSARLTRVWGRSHPAKGLVTLHPRLRREAKRHLEEVLCHELAHVVVWLDHGRRAKPHGPEWRALVELAGQQARLRLSSSVSPPLPSRREGTGTEASGGRRWEHRCPVCQMVRVAKRPVRGWRCAECRAAGLEGALEISPLLPASDGPVCLPSDA